MSHPHEPHSFFSTPVWPRSSFRGARSQRRSSSSSSAFSSPSGSDENLDSNSDSDTRRRRRSSLSSSSSEEDDNDELNPLFTSSIHLRGRHRKRQSALLAAHSLTAAPREAYTLRTRHIAVITTLLHRCLLCHDWERARRAFGLLIRGKDVDIRRIWGVGLDILLRLGGEGAGMQNAIEYLKRLALFFPFRPRLHSHHPVLVDEGDDASAGGNNGGKEDGKSGRKRRKPGSTAAAEKKKRAKKERLPPYVSAVEFNPLLFILLIESSKEVDPERVAENEDGNGVNAGYNATEDTSPERIKARLEELMLTPPWDGMAVLKLLKGMVCLWLIDVEKQRAAAKRIEDEEWENEADRENGMDEETKEKIEMLRIEAKETFEQMKKKKESLPDGVEWWLDHYDDEEEDEEDYGNRQGRMDEDEGQDDSEEYEDEEMEH